MKLDLQDLKAQLDQGVIISKQKWLEVLAYAMELEEAKYAKPVGQINDWQDHDGGDQPVADGIAVDVEFRYGGIRGDFPSDFWRWNHAGADGDIIRYRIKD